MVTASRRRANYVTIGVVKNATNPPPVPPAEIASVRDKCAACGHSRAHHISIDGPCKVHRGREFCDCDHFSPMRPVVVAPVATPPE